MQNTQQKESLDFQWYIDYENCNLDYEETLITFSNGVNVDLEVAEGGPFKWVLHDTDLSHWILRRISKLYPSNLSIYSVYSTFQLIRDCGLHGELFQRDEHYIMFDYDADTSPTIVWTPQGLRALAVLFPLLGCSLEDAKIFIKWLDTFEFIGELAKEKAIDKRKELLSGWRLSSKQLAKALGISMGAVRAYKARNKDKLIQGIHWDYSSEANKTMYFTKLGCLILSSIVNTQEAKATKLFLESTHNTSLEELSLAS